MHLGAGICFSSALALALVFGSELIGIGIGIAGTGARVEVRCFDVVPPLHSCKMDLTRAISIPSSLSSASVTASGA